MSIEVSWKIQVYFPCVLEVTIKLDYNIMLCLLCPLLITVYYCLMYAGIWRTTYLDEDFRILYATGGKNTVKENVYILTK